MSCRRRALTEIILKPLGGFSDPEVYRILHSSENALKMCLSMTHCPTTNKCPPPFELQVKTILRDGLDNRINFLLTRDYFITTVSKRNVSQFASYNGNSLNVQFFSEMHVRLKLNLAIDIFLLCLFYIVTGKR